MRIPLLVVLGATSGFLIYGLAVDSPFVNYYVPITLLLSGLAVWLHRTLSWPPRMLWGLVSVAIGNLAGGVVLVDGQPLYSLALVGELRYDKPFHAFATGVAAWIALWSLEAWSGRSGGFGLAFAAVLIANGAGAMVEMVEYAGSIIFEQTSVGDYANNMLDLVANLAGSIAAVAVAPAAPGSPATLDRHVTGSRTIET